MKKLVLVYVFLSFSSLFGNNSVNFRDLDLKDFISIVSKSLNKNILISANLNSKIDFVSNTDLKKDQLFELLKISLNKNGLDIKKHKGFYVVDRKEILTKKHIKTIPIKNTEAKEIYDILKSLKIDKQLIISHNKEDNSIILLGKLEEIDVLKEFIKSLDKEKIQVFIQTKIIEVNNEKISKVGFSYGLFTSQDSSNNIFTLSSSLNGGSTSLEEVGSVLGLNIPNLASSLALGASLNLLKQNGALNILSQPSILALNNKESDIYSGQTISIKTSFSLSDGGTSSENFKREDVGLSLKVKPRIASFDKLNLDISTIIEGIKTTQTQSGNADTSKKSINTSVILNNGESVIIGGLTQEKNETTLYKVPLLGDIPLVGTLFQNKSNNTFKDELLIVVTPYIIPKSRDITFINSQLAILKSLENKYLKDSLGSID
ncbi:MAG: Type IV pilus biogenesis and competence protein PilQ [Arcobacter lacus]|jgi:general secretion pathway protein D|nr:MAG: Type IV pilus biogenesis and competence protein PilQ [Arcobacter lacus]